MNRRLRPLSVLWKALLSIFVWTFSICEPSNVTTSLICKFSLNPQKSNETSQAPQNSEILVDKKAIHSIFKIATGKGCKNHCSDKASYNQYAEGFCNVYLGYMKTIPKEFYFVQEISPEMRCAKWVYNPQINYFDVEEVNDPDIEYTSVCSKEKLKTSEKFKEIVQSEITTSAPKWETTRLPETCAKKNRKMYPIRSFAEAKFFLNSKFKETVIQIKVDWENIQTYAFGYIEKGVDKAKQLQYILNWEVIKDPEAKEVVQICE